ncbi:hypothetical protein [Xanthomonas maliensis]|uniref:hypothetical protein n=1 Tax=Xanthomonas maliensis TaxID=1321368 RepID=UPI0003A864E9|nr:hypothetical protein [Xanthomonas maliensis]KAB7771537.1 hypothetical protein CKY51_02780 [Xanthomonas maliensis]
MNTKSQLETHDERQSAYRGPGPDAAVDGRGRHDPSVTATDDGTLPNSEASAGGHGQGATPGRGEPDGRPQRDGRTQPNLGQHGSYGKQQSTTDDRPGDTGQDDAGA